MAEPALALVRHAQVRPDPSQPAEQWRVTDQGRAASRALAAGIYRRDPGIAAMATSPEIKAVETASELAHGLRTTGLGLQVSVDQRLREAARPWTDDHAAYKALVARYLKGEELNGWEPRDAVVERFSAAIDQLIDPGAALAVTHGIAMTAWLASVLPDLEPVGFWTQLRFPDAWLVDRGRGMLERLAT